MTIGCMGWATCENPRRVERVRVYTWYGLLHARLVRLSVLRILSGWENSSQSVIPNNEWYDVQGINELYQVRGYLGR